MINVGDWVKREHADGIARVISIEEDMAVLYTGGVQSCEYLEELTKLPIKFKGFNIVMCYARNWECYRNTKSIGKIHFVCIQEGAEYFTGFKVPHESFVIKYCNTIQQSELWLELQYAILLAKARGLV